MKILWISNIIFPEACEALGVNAPVIGGWMQSSANAIVDYFSNIELAVASLYNGKTLKVIDDYKITYFLIPKGKNDQKYDKSKQLFYGQIKEYFSPDIVHIHGTEYPHSLAAFKAFEDQRVVVSIQGLVSSCSNYYYGGIGSKILLQNLTLRDVFRWDTPMSQKRKMNQRAKYEIELIKKAHHFIGRTSWDESQIWTINPKAVYHFCNETLRPSFYNKTWDFDKCNQHSIFLSQASYPIKGGHVLLKALPYVLERYPNTKVYIAGSDIMNKPWYRTNTYSMYLKYLIKKLKLTKTVQFVGLLQEKQMAEYYASSNVFVCPSAIENSPNSIGEAQLIGVPVIASYVGGIMDMIKHGVTGFLYRYEEYQMLAKYICQLFSSKETCVYLSNNARDEAINRHDKKNNAYELFSIYKLISES